MADDDTGRLARHLRAMRTYKAEEWQRVREQGKRSFLFRHGFLGRGLPLGLLMGLVLESLVGGQFPDALYELTFWSRTAFCVAVFTASGCISSNANWNLHERRHSPKP